MQHISLVEYCSELCAFYGILIGSSDCRVAVCVNRNLLAVIPTVFSFIRLERVILMDCNLPFLRTNTEFMRVTLCQ